MLKALDVITTATASTDLGDPKLLTTQVLSAYNTGGNDRRGTESTRGFEKSTATDHSCYLTSVRLKATAGKPLHY
jgi:hypothetical protein